MDAEDREYEANSLLTSVEEDQRILGRGSFATVLCCRHDKLGDVAVKCLDLTGSKEAILDQKEEIRKRVKVLMKLKHDNIIPVFGAVSLPYKYGIIMENATLGNLYDLLFLAELVKKLNITWVMKMTFLEDIASGLNFLHNLGPQKSLIHKDVKSENILITSGMVLKIADFGSFDIKMATGASTTTDLQSNTQYTLQYAAPEYLRSIIVKTDLEFHPSTAMDVYSFAMVAYEVITRHCVYSRKVSAAFFFAANVLRDKKPDSQILKDIELLFSDSQRNDQLIFCFLKSVMEKCWESNPLSRPNISEVLKDIATFKKEIDGYHEKNEQDSLKLENAFLKVQSSRANSIKSSNKLVSLIQYFNPVFGQKDMEEIAEESAGKVMINVVETLESMSISPTTSKKLEAVSPERKALQKSKLADSHNDNSTSKINYSENSAQMQKVSLMRLNDCYNMNHEMRGVFIIFCQETCVHPFVPDLSAAKTEAIALAHMAKTLGFEFTNIIYNSTKAQILDSMFTLSRANHLNYDCFGCAIIAAGDEDDLLFALDDTFYLSEVLQFFSSGNCPSLAGKPKLFFINASRGQKMLSLNEMESYNRRFVRYFDSHSGFGLHRKPHKPYPNLRDFVLVFSSMPGYVSFQDSFGSSFIQNLTRCFVEYKETDDLLSMLTKVNKLILNHTSYSFYPGGKQCLSINTYLTDKVYFRTKSSRLFAVM